MIAIVHSIYSQSVHAPALNAELMDNDAERYCTMQIYFQSVFVITNHDFFSIIILQYKLMVI